MRKTSILILNYKTWDKTLEEIKLIIKVLNFNPQDIIVVDNNSDNNSSEKLSDNAKLMHYVFIESKQNNGYAAGNNIGLKYSYQNGYKYCLIMNNDIFFDDSKLLDKLISVFDKDNTLACVNPDIYSPEGKLYNRDCIRPSFFDLTVGMLNYRSRGREIVDKGGYCEVYRPQGCCMLLDLNKIDEIGYLDENTFLYCEEPILAEMLDKNGYKCACCLNSRIVHDHSVTVMSSSTLKKHLKTVDKSFKYYLMRYRNFNDLQISLCLLFNRIKTVAIYKRNIKNLKKNNR